VKRKWKILILAAALVTIGLGVYASTVYSRRGIVSVQTARVIRQDLSSLVTAAGEIKPRNYINIGANAQGQIVEILVKEGDRVRKGQLLARLESVQPEAELSAQSAATLSAEAEAAAAEAGLRAAEENIATMAAAIERVRAEVERARLDFERAQHLSEQQLISRQEYDLRRSTFDAQKAALREAEARMVQAKAERQRVASQLSASQRRVSQSQAMMTRAKDVLSKRNAYAPLEGVVTNLPVRVGEIVVPGIQNSPASTIMTIADMSLITAEVKVDETDIVDIALGQTADITIDAIPNKTFKGHVIEIGNTAILRSSGLAASQSNISSQEAKDFKVVIALDAPPDEVRPGLSCSAKVVTAVRKGALSVPIQALTVRQRGDLEPRPKGGSGKAQAAAKLDREAEKKRKEEIQGVFVIENRKAVFRKVETGISGSTDLEVLSGLKEGDEIITGSYQVIRTLRNEAQVKVDNQAGKSS
jgi:HlyD family secretion protein